MENVAIPILSMTCHVSVYCECRCQVFSPVVSGQWCGRGSVPCTPHTHPGWGHTVDTQLSNCCLEPATGGDPLSIIMMIRGQLVDTSTGASDASLLEVATCLHLPGFSNVC